MSDQKTQITPTRFRRILIAMCLLPIVLIAGFMIFCRMPSRLKRDVESIGGQYTINRTDANVGIITKVRNMLNGNPPVDSYSVIFDSRSVGVDDQWLREHREDLEALPYLRLMIANTKITDQGIWELKGMKNLQSLHLIGNSFTIDSLPAIATLQQLFELDIAGINISGKDLSQLKKLPELCVLKIDNDQALSGGIEAIKTFPKVVNLEIQNTTDSTIDALAIHNLTPRFLVLNGKGITRASFTHFAKLQNRKSLILQNTLIEGDQIEELENLLPNCHVGVYE